MRECDQGDRYTLTCEPRFHGMYDHLTNMICQWKPKLEGGGKKKEKKEKEKSTKKLKEGYTLRNAVPAATNVASQKTESEMASTRLNNSLDSRENCLDGKRSTEPLSNQELPINFKLSYTGTDSLLTDDLTDDPLQLSQLLNISALSGTVEAEIRNFPEVRTKNGQKKDKRHISIDASLSHGKHGQAASG